jgi:hypothetical protein
MPELKADVLHRGDHTEKRTIDPDELIGGDWDDMAQLAVIFNHEIIETTNGVYRWKLNKLISLFMDHAPVYAPSQAEARAIGEHDGYCSRKFTGRASLDLNTLCIDAYNGFFTIEEWMKFNMQHGYSLQGLSEVFGQRNAYEFKLPGAKTRETKANNGYAETVLQYMCRVHKGKVLKL